MEPVDYSIRSSMTQPQPEPILEWTAFFSEARRLAALARTRRGAVQPDAGLGADQT